MKITEIVTDGVPCIVKHPEIGRVAWKEQGPGSGYALYFAIEGRHDFDWPLLADVAVLFENTWSRST